MNSRHLGRRYQEERRNTTISNNFRVGVRRKFPTSATTEISTTASRPTKIKHRRKYLTRSTTKRIESQESTTPKLRTENRFRFVPRRTTQRTTHKPQDQTQKSTSYQTSEKEQTSEKVIDYTDLSAALQSIQKAPIPQGSFQGTLKLPQTTEKYIIKTSKIPQTTPTSQLRSRGTRPQIILNKSNIQTSAISRPQPFRPQSSPYPPPVIITSSTPSTVQAYRRVTAPIISTSHSSSDHDFYQTAGGGTVAQLSEHSKVLLHSNGVIECLDQGNFPHPASCRKFISCAEMGFGKVLGWEYTCPKNLSFDPIGGICNWSTELGCDEQ